MNDQTELTREDLDAVADALEHAYFCLSGTSALLLVMKRAMNDIIHHGTKLDVEVHRDVAAAHKLITEKLGWIDVQKNLVDKRIAHMSVDIMTDEQPQNTH